MVQKEYFSPDGLFLVDNNNSPLVPLLELPDLSSILVRPSQSLPCIISHTAITLTLDNHTCTHTPAYILHIVYICIYFVYIGFGAPYLFVCWFVWFNTLWFDLYIVIVSRLYLSCLDCAIPEVLFKNPYFDSRPRSKVTSGLIKSKCYKPVINFKVSLTFFTTILNVECVC